MRVQLPTESMGLGSPEAGDPLKQVVVHCPM